MLQRRIQIAVLVAALVANASLAEDPSPRLDPVQRDVTDLLHALYRGDLETVLQFTHPTIIQMMGGPEAARSATEQALQHIAHLQMKLESLSFPHPPEFLEGGGRPFAIVPTLIILSANGQQIESLNFQVGVRDADSSKWKYVEGSRINKQNVQVLFPGFQAEYEFPAFYRKKL